MAIHIVLRYVVETWNTDEAEWECRYQTVPGYRYVEETNTVGYLWWRRSCDKWVVTNGDEAQRRALLRATRHANGLLGDYIVRILMVTSGAGLSPDFNKLIWAGGEFIV